MPLAFRIAVVVIICAACVFVFSAAVAGFPDPPGADGYYYLKQIERLAAGDGYYYKDRSVAFLLPAALAALSGDSLCAFRLSIAITWALLAVCAGMLAYQAASAAGLTGRSRALFGIIPALTVASSLTVYELLFEYYKTAVSSLFLIGAAVLRYSPPISAKIRAMLSTIFVCLALVSHKSAFLFIILYTAVWFLQNRSRKNILILAGMGTCSFLAFLIFFERGWYYLMALPDFFAPPAHWFEWLGYILENDPAMSLTLGMALASLISYVRERRNFPYPLRTLFDTISLSNALVFVPVFLTGPAGPTYRLALLSPLFSAALLLLSTVGSWPSTAAAGILIALFLFQIVLDHTRILRHFPGWSALDQDMMRITRHVQTGDHLIAHHGLEFYVDYRTGIRARQFLSSHPQKKSYRLAYIPPGRPGGEARIALEKVMLERLGEKYGLFREDDWTRIVKRYSIRPHWKNPTDFRSDYIPDYD